MLDIVSISKLTEFDRLRLRLVFFIVFLVFIVVSILSYSIYLSYEDQRISEVAEIHRSIYLDVGQLLDKENMNIRSLVGYDLPENTIVCISKDGHGKICLENVDGQNLIVKNDVSRDDSFIVYSNKYDGIDVFIATSKDEIEKELKKLAMSIVVSDALVLLLSAFLSYSVFGRLLSPVKIRINKLNQTLQIISHDLRTPISVIDTNLYLIKSKGECKSERLNSIEKNITYMKNLIKNIDYLTEKVPTKIEKVEINQVVREILDKYSTFIENKGIRVEFLEKGRFFVNGNYTDIEVLFSNLIDNAIKYNHDNGKLIVEIESDRISIKNTGPKIKDKTKIFEKYYREDFSGTVQGMGIGLSIVKNLCKVYGLKIEVNHQDDMNVFTVSKR